MASRNRHAGAYQVSAIANPTAAIVLRDDEQLMAEIASGDRDAFDELYSRYRNRAFRVARSVCRDREPTEDAVQDAFAAIWRGRSTYQAARGPVSPWLLSLVRNRAVDVARENGKHAVRRALEETPDVRLAPGDVMDSVVERHDAAELRARLARLPELQREVVTLAYYGELSHSEIATRLDLPAGTVKGRMRLGLQRLRVSVDETDTSERLHTALAGALRDGDVDDARRVMREAAAEMPAATVLDDVLAPAMHSIGALWEAAAITVADEHLATTICDQLLAEISPALQTARVKSRETVLLATPASEGHTLGLRMASAVLYGGGYDTVLLGSGVPPAELKAVLLRHQPAIVALSSSMPRPAALATTVSLIHETLPAAQLVTGGATARQLPPHAATQHIARLDGLLAAVGAIVATSADPR